MLPQLAIPIHEKAFGKNKTIRGFIFIPLTAMLGGYLTFLLQPNSLFQIFPNIHESLLAGFLLGIAYAIGELPNSYWKRKKGIKEGKKSTKKNRFLHIIVDQCDSAFPVMLFYLYYHPMVNLKIATSAIAISILVHLLINFLLYVFKLRREPL